MSIAIALLSAWPFEVEANASDGQIIVSRQENSIDVFFKITGEALTSLTNEDTSFLFDEVGRIDINGFRQDTAPWGDQVFADVSFIVGGRLADAEAISLMMHEKGEPIPFMTPWDALTAVTICIAPANTPPLSLEETQSYLGFSIYPIDGQEDLQLQFPLTGRNPVTFDVSTFFDGELVTQDFVTLSDGGLLHIHYMPRSETLVPTFYFQILLLLLTAVHGVVLVGGLNQRARSPLYDL